MTQKVLLCIVFKKKKKNGQTESSQVKSNCVNALLFSSIDHSPAGSSSSGGGGGSGDMRDGLQIAPSTTVKH